MAPATALDIGLIEAKPPRSPEGSGELSEDASGRGVVLRRNPIAPQKPIVFRIL